MEDAPQATYHSADAPMEVRRRTMDRRVTREAEAIESLLQPGDATSYRQPRLYTEAERSRMATYESVDAFEPHNSVYLDHLQFRYSEPRWFVWVFTLVVGLLSGLCAVLFVAAMHVLISMKYYLLDYAIRGFPYHSAEDSRDAASDIFKGWQLPMQGNSDRNIVLGYIMWAGFSVVCALIAAVLLKLVPEARGVGSPDVLAYLNGVDHGEMSNKRVFAARMVISLLTIASGACTGYFGTLIQCGVMISTFITERSRLIQFPNINVVRCFRNPKDRRNLAIIGAAAGVGSAFSVTIGGLMYVVEQIAQVIPVRVRLYTFCSCLISSFTMQVYFSYMNGFGDRDRSEVSSGGLLHDALIIFDTKLVRSTIVGMNIFDILPAAIIGVICGGLSVLYVRLSWVSLRLRRRLQTNFFHNFKYLQPVVITLIYVTATYWIAVAWGPHVAATDKPGAGCSYVPAAFETKRKISVIGFYGTVSSICDVGPFYNETDYVVNGTLPPSPQDPLSPGPGPDGRMPVIHNFGSLALSPADSALQLLLSWSTADYLQLPTLIVFFLVYFVFTAFTAGIAMAGDVILPALVIGATVGRICGQITRITAEAISFETLTWADPALFALVGAGSFLGGVTGMTFSICIILMEMTGDNRHIICLMIGISISKMIADRFCHPITVSHLEASCVPILDFAARIHKYDMFCARNVMQSPVLTFTTVMTAQSIVDALGTTHNGFPVVSVRDRTFKGIVLRWQLEVVLWNLHWTRKGDACTYARMREIEDRRFSERLVGKLPPLSKKLLRTHIDVLAYVDQSAYYVHEATSLSRTYHMFRTLGLRHLVVINRANQVVGMITRKDLVSDKMMEKIGEENDKRREQLLAAAGGGGAASSSMGGGGRHLQRDGSSPDLPNRAAEADSLANGGEVHSGELTHDGLSVFLLQQHRKSLAAAEGKYGETAVADIYGDSVTRGGVASERRGLLGGFLNRFAPREGSEVTSHGRRVPQLSELIIDEYEDQEYTIIDARESIAPEVGTTPPRSPTAASPVGSTRYGGTDAGVYSGRSARASVAIDSTTQAPRQSVTAGRLGGGGGVAEGYLHKNLVVAADEEDLENFYAMASTKVLFDPRHQLVTSPVGVAAADFASPVGIAGLGALSRTPSNHQRQQQRSTPPPPREPEGPMATPTRALPADNDALEAPSPAYGGYTAPVFTPAASTKAASSSPQKRRSSLPAEEKSDTTTATEPPRRSLVASAQPEADPVVVEEEEAADTTQLDAEEADSRDADGQQ